MRAVVITRPDGPDSLEILDVPRPEPRGDQVLVKVHAAGLNRADLLQSLGRYPAPAGSPPDIPGLEFAGEIASLGPDARGGLKVGDRVFGIVGGGGLAEYVVTHERLAVPIPPSLDWDQAASIPESFITALDALDQSGLRPGQSVLIHAAAGGVGSAAVQIARAMGCTTLGTSRTQSKLDRARDELGLDVGLLSSPSTLASDVLSHTSGLGVSAVIDHLAGPYLVPSLESLTDLGTLVLVGLLAGPRVDSFPLDLLLRKRLRLLATTLRSRPLEQKISATQRFSQSVLPWLQRGTVLPLVDSSFPLDQIHSACSRMSSNSPFGKILLRP